MKYSFEKLSDTIEICISDEHRFGTDAFLLADFSRPKHKDNVCDLCSGSGIVALLMKRNSQPKSILAVEIQESAVSLIEKSIEKSLLTGLTPLCADLREISRLPSHGEFDLVTCNPPYKIDNTGAKNENEASSIARHEVLCTADDVCKAASKLLKPGGRLCLCNRPERLCDVIISMKKYKLEPKRLRFVSKNPSSQPWLFLIEGKKGAKPFLQVEKPLFIQGENGFSDELKKIYGNGVK